MKHGFSVSGLLYNFNFLFQKSFIDLNSITWLTADYKKIWKKSFI